MRYFYVWQGFTVTFYPTDRLALFIDGANLYSAAKSLGFDIDYKRLLEEFRKRGVLIRAYYYTALVEDQDYSPIRPLVDWLDYNGFTLVTKTAPRNTPTARAASATAATWTSSSRSTCWSWPPKADHMVLFSGDSDFAHLVAAVQRKGVRVTVVSTLKSQPPMASDDLRRQADAFVDLADLADIIGRAPREPAAALPAGDPRRPRMTEAAAEPPRDCPLCPRLAAYRAENRAAHPDWWNGPAPSFGDPDARLLVVGLAPGRQGANRTGRPFTGDFAGVLLYETLIALGFARAATRRGRTTG